MPLYNVYKFMKMIRARVKTIDTFSMVHPWGVISANPRFMVSQSLALSDKSLKFYNIWKQL